MVLVIHYITLVTTFIRVVLFFSVILGIFHRVFYWRLLRNRINKIFFYVHFALLLSLFLNGINIKIKELKNPGNLFLKIYKGEHFSI